MAYGRRRFSRSYSRPRPRGLPSVKFAAPCICCGGIIKVGEDAVYYPAGTIAGINVGKIAHPGGLDGTSLRCFNVLKAKAVEIDAEVNDYAGDGLDTRWEDSMRDICGL